MRHTGEEPVKECPLNSAATVNFTKDQNTEPAALSGYQIQPSDKIHMLKKKLF